MTQQRDAGQDRQLIKDLGELEIHHPQACELYNHLHEIGKFWIEEGEAQRIRAEEAEQERDKLRSNLRMIKNSIEQFKGAVSLLDFQLEGYGLYEERD